MCLNMNRGSPNYSRNAGGLVKKEAKKTKRFVKGLTSKLRSKLVPLQLRIYVYAIEKALEVEVDIQKGQKDWVRDFSVSKCP